MGLNLVCLIVHDLRKVLVEKNVKNLKLLFLANLFVNGAVLSARAQAANNARFARLQNSTSNFSPIESNYKTNSESKSIKVIK